VVEKKAVEMNALADELQASPRLAGQRRPSVPAPTNPVVVAAAAGAPSRAAATDRPDHLRRQSFERRQGVSASSAIARALSLASGRLLTLGLSPPPGLGKGAPPSYSPFPQYPVAGATGAGGGQLRLEDAGPGGREGEAAAPPQDEDSRACRAIEEAATRSDVVYGFAEVKYAQLIPHAPSTERGLGLRGVDPGDGGADGLTPDALLTICEEALVLYVRALALLARAMDIAGAWWSRKSRAEAAGPPPTSAAARLNSCVQWVRARFNEALEKAEFVRRKLLDAQAQLPPAHPAHPSRLPAAALAASGLDVHISAGVSADRIMYQRAVEMGKSAAVNELMAEDLAGCEISYVTAVRMLEVVLESSGEGEEEEGAGGGAEGESDGPPPSELDREDRESVVKSRSPPSSAEPVRERCEDDGFADPRAQ